MTLKRVVGITGGIFLVASIIVSILMFLVMLAMLWEVLAFWNWSGGTLPFLGVGVFLMVALTIVRTVLAWAGILMQTWEEES